MKILKSNRWLWTYMCVVAGIWCLSFTVNTRVYATIDALGGSEAAAISAASGATEPTISDPTYDDKGSASLPGANSSDTATKDDIKDGPSAQGIQKLGDSVVKAGSGDTATLQSTDTRAETSLKGDGTEDFPYLISTYEGLKEFARIVNDAKEEEELDAWAILTADIECDAEADANWIPIGNDDSHMYSGTFDGENHTIKGLTISGNDSDEYVYVGLFGYVGAGGVVKNVGLVDGHINGIAFVGAVVGYNEGKVENCYNTGAVTGTGADIVYVGGVVGYNVAYDKTAQVINCYNTGAINVIGNSYQVDVGGVVGLNEGKVENCYNTGSVTAESIMACVGGVVGLNYGEITNCYNTGDVKVDGSGAAYAGGVVGLNEGKVENCYNTGDVTGAVAEDATGDAAGNETEGKTEYYVYVGGVVGYNIVNIGPQVARYNTRAETGNDVTAGRELEGDTENTVKVTNCYNTGSVTATATSTSTSSVAHVGGVVGRNEDGTVTNCYYDRTRCTIDGANGDNDWKAIGNIVESGSEVSNVKGLTTAQMTGENALREMKLAGDLWLTKADEKVEDQYYWYYPHLKGFNFKDSANTPVKWPLEIADGIEQMDVDEIEAEAWPSKIEVSVVGEGLGPYTYDGLAHSFKVDKILVIAGDTIIPDALSDLTIKYFKYQESADESQGWVDAAGDYSEPGKYKMEFCEGTDEDLRVIATKYFTTLDPGFISVLYNDKSTEPPINAGDYEVTIEFKKYGDKTADVGILKIDPVDAKITVSDASKTYGKGDPEFTKAELEGAIGSELVDISLNVIRTNKEVEAAGTYTGVLQIEETKDELDSAYPNYTFTIDYGDFTIYKSSDWSVTGENYEGKYDGEFHGEAAKATVTDETTYKYSTDSGKTWSSDYPKIIDVGEINVEVKAINPNYEDAKGKYTLKVTTRDAKIKVSDESKTYGESDPEFTKAKLEGEIGSELVDISLNVIRTNKEVEAAGTYTGVLQIEETKDELDSAYPNYTFTIDYGDFTIYKSSDWSVTGENYEGKYDGEFHGEAAKATVTDETTYKYSTDSGKTWSSDYPKIIDVGEINVEVKATNPNYEDAKDTYTLKVTKRSATIQVSDASKTYGDDDPKLTATVNGLVGTDKIYYELSRDKGEDVGEYDIEVKPSEEYTNYDIEIIYGKFTINQAQPKYEAPDLIDGTQDKSTQDQALGKPKGVNGKDLSGKWEWSTASKYLGSGKKEYPVTFTPDSPNYSELTSKVKVSTWGKEVNDGTAENPVMNYVSKDGTTSAEVTGNGIIWLKEESEGLSTWYGLDNSEGTFATGSKFWVRWLSREADPDDWQKYYVQLDDEHKKLAEDKKLWIFLVGVTVIDPDGYEYEYNGNFDPAVDLYIQLGTDWDKDDINAVFISDTVDEKLSVEVLGGYVLPDGTKAVVAKVGLEHFSPYAVYETIDDQPGDDTQGVDDQPGGNTQVEGNDHESDQASTAMHSSGTSSDSKVYKTSDTMTVEALLSLELFMVLSLIGLYFSLKRKRI